MLASYELELKFEAFFFMSLVFLTDQIHAIVEYLLGRSSCVPAIANCHFAICQHPFAAVTCLASVDS